MFGAQDDILGDKQGFALITDDHLVLVLSFEPHRRRSTFSSSPCCGPIQGANGSNSSMNIGEISLVARIHKVVERKGL